MRTDLSSLWERFSSRAVVYGSEPLDEAADGTVLVCCSQPNSDVVIDL